MKQQSKYFFFVITLVVLLFTCEWLWPPAKADDAPKAPTGKVGTESHIPSDFPNQVKELKKKLMNLKKWTLYLPPHQARDEIMKGLNKSVSESKASDTELIVRYIKKRAEEVDNMVDQKTSYEVNALMASFLRKSLDLAIEFNQYDVEAANQPKVQGATFTDFTLIYSAFLIQTALKFYFLEELEYKIARLALGYTFNDLKMNEQVHSPEKWKALLDDFQFMSYSGFLPEPPPAVPPNDPPKNLTWQDLSNKIYGYFSTNIRPILKDELKPELRKVLDELTEPLLTLGFEDPLVTKLEKRKIPDLGLEAYVVQGKKGIEGIQFLEVDRIDYYGVYRAINKASVNIYIPRELVENYGSEAVVKIFLSEETCPDNNKLEVSKYKITFDGAAIDNIKKVGWINTSLTVKASHDAKLLFTYDYNVDCRVTYSNAMLVQEIPQILWQPVSAPWLNFLIEYK